MPGPCGPYNSKGTGSSYTLNTNKSDFASAEQNCNRIGGHLAAWNSELEQREVENFFLTQGCLIPPFHNAYWFGLTTNDEPKNTNGWYWLDHSPAPTPQTYVKWGTRKPQNVPEPANLMGAETCGACNVTEAFAGTWGWASAQCQQPLAYICEKNRKWHAFLRRSCTALAAAPASRTCCCLLARAVFQQQL